MLTYEQAVEHILSTIEPLPGEMAILPQCINRALMQDIVAPIDLPPFDNSQMDGYALIAADTHSATDANPVKLDVIGEVQAGLVTEEIRLRNGQCVRIFTGAPMPKSADSVIPQEDVQIAQNEQIQILAPVKAGEFVRYAASDVKAGAPVLKSGTILRPGEIALLASLGFNEVLIGRQLSYGLICTGNELVSPGNASLGYGQIYNSNESSMLATFNKLDDFLRYPKYAHAGDRQEEMERALNEINHPGRDITVICGGVSVGKYDYVKPAILALGGTLDFTQVAIRPGKPTVFGSLFGKPIFGLPGNPVSAMVTFDLFVRPAILRLAGYPLERCCRPLIDAILTEPISHEPGRRTFARARVDFVDATIRVTPFNRQRSDQISGMAGADSLLVIPEDVESLDADSKVKVMLLD